MLLELQKRNGYSYEHLGKKLNICKTFCWQLLHRKRRMTYAFALKFSMIYKTYPNQFFGYNIIYYQNKGDLNSIKTYVGLENLKKIRKEKGFTIYDIAYQLKITPPFYSQIENGKRRLFCDTLLKIAQILEESPDFLVYNDFIIQNENESN